MKILYNLHDGTTIHNLKLYKPIELKQLPPIYLSYLCIDKEGGQWLCLQKIQRDIIIGQLDNNEIDTSSDIKSLLNTCKSVYLYQRDINGYDRIYDITKKIDKYLHL